MRYEMRKLEAKNAETILPPHIISRLNEKGIETVVAIDDENGNEIVGIAVFLYPDNVALAVALLYIYMAEEYRTVENGINLVGYALDILAVRGAKKVFWDLRVSEEDGKREKFIEKNGFMLAARSGHFLSYDMKMIQNSVFAKRVDEMEALMSHVKFLDELDEKQFQRFQMQATLEGHEVNLTGMDSQYACFYIENDAIKAYYDLREVTSGKIYMVDSYVLEGCNKVRALPAMLAKFVQTAKAFATNDTKVVLPLFTAEEYNGIKAIFGNPEFEEIMNVYEKLI